MLDSVRSGLDRAAELPVGTTTLDLGGYFHHLGGVTRAGLRGEVSSHFHKDWSAFAHGSVGLQRWGGSTRTEVLGLIGLRGTF